MEKTLKKRIVIGVGALAVGSVLAFGAVPALVRQNNRTETVVRAVKTIGVGEKITDANVKLEQVFANDQPGGAEKSLSAVIGKTAKVEINPRDTVTSSKISDTVQAVPADKQEISVSVKNNAAGLTGQLQAGDIVSVYGVSTGAGAGVSQRLDALKYVKVLGYFSGATGSSSGSTANATLTLLVDPKQALILSAWDNSSLHFALVSRGDATKASDLLKQQDAIDATIPDANLISTGVGQQTGSATASGAAK